jgi:hypothetical protein
MIDWICNAPADGILWQCKKGMPKSLPEAPRIIGPPNGAGGGLSKALGG